MPPVIEACIVAGTLALIAVALACVRAMLRLEDTASRMSRLADAARIAIHNVDRTARETGDLVASLHDVVTPIQRVGRRFVSLGERTADLSAAALGEIELPILTALALSRGVRAATTTFFERLVYRFSGPHVSTNGETRNEFQATGRP
jgi:hypothetical protein